MKLMETYIHELGDFEITLDGKYPLNLIVPHNISDNPFLTVSSNAKIAKAYAVINASDNDDVLFIDAIVVFPDGAATSAFETIGGLYPSEAKKWAVDNMKLNGRLISDFADIEFFNC